MERQHVKSVLSWPPAPPAPLPPHQRSVSSHCADKQCFFADLAGGPQQQQHRAGLLSVVSSHRPINNHHFAQISGGAAPRWPWSGFCQGAPALLSSPLSNHVRQGALKLCAVVWLWLAEGRDGFFFFFWINLCLACKISRARCEMNISCATLPSPLGFLCPAASEPLCPRCPLALWLGSCCFSKSGPCLQSGLLGVSWQENAYQAANQSPHP